MKSIIYVAFVLAVILVLNMTFIVMSTNEQATAEGEGEKDRICALAEEPKKNIDGWKTEVAIHLPTGVQKKTFYTRRKLVIFVVRGTVSLYETNCLGVTTNCYVSTTQHIEILSQRELNFNNSQLSKKK